MSRVRISQASVSRRQLVGVSLATLGGIALAACAAQSPEPVATIKPGAQATGAGPAGASSAPASSVAVTIEYWRPVKNKGEENATAEIIKNFTQMHPSVTVKAQYMPQAQETQKFLTAYATGTGPDIGTLDGGNSAVYAAAGALAALPDDMNTFIKDKVYPFVQQQLMWKGKWFTVPLDRSDEVLGYNVAMFEGAGIKTGQPPQDWEEFIGWAQKLTKRDASGHLVQAGIELSLASSFDWTTWLGAAGGQYWHTLDHVDFTDPPFIAAMQLWQDLLYKYKVYDVGAPPNLFTNGKAAMVMAGPWTIQGMQQSAPNIKWASWLMPPWKASGTTGSTIGGFDLGVSSKSKSLDMTWEFVRFALQEDNRVLWFKATYRTSPFKDIQDNPIFKSDPNFENLQKQMAYGFGQGTPSSIAMADVGNAVTLIMDQSLKEHQDVAKVAAAQKAKIDPIFAQKNQGS